MGEAKRRKQALGDRYGKTPPLLIPESKQLQEHTKRFATCYFTKFDKLNASQSENDKSGQDITDSDSNQRPDTRTQEMQQWVQEYFEPYRPKDREQLVMGILEPFYFVLFEAHAQYFKKQPNGEQPEFINSLAGGLTCLGILRPYLSQPKLEEYVEPMRSLYWDMINTLEGEELEEDDLSHKAAKLTRLFQCCLDIDDVPKYVAL